MIELNGTFEKKRGKWSSEKRNVVIIKDPLIMKTKCAPSVTVNKDVNLKKCRCCNLPRHNRRKCSVLNQVYLY